MNKLIFVIGGVSLATVILLTACSLKSTPGIAQAATYNITGSFCELDNPVDGGNTTITVQTKQGQQTVQVTTNTTFIVEGKNCNYEDVGNILAGDNTSYICTLVIDNGCDYAKTIYLEKQ